MRVGPVAFLVLVPALWTGVRAVMLWPQALEDGPRRMSWAEPLPKAALPESSPARPNPERRIARSIAGRQGSVRLPRPRALKSDGGNSLMAFQGWTSRIPGTARAEPMPQAQLAPGIWPGVAQFSDNRFSVSAWTLLRSDVSTGLAPGGQLAGSQAGLRTRYRLTNQVHLAARISGPIQSSRGKEAALALDVRPLSWLPVTISVERRIGLDRGGRDAFAIGAFGGLESELAPGLRLDGYGQVGLVGLKRRDRYVDGALRAERHLLRRGDLRIGFGAGAWGGAQPGVARLDVGPQLVAHLPIASGGVRVGTEWRQRVAGDARPGSGPVLSLGADF